MNDKDKLINKIISLEKRIWIPLHIDKKEELMSRDIDSLKRLLRANEIVIETTKTAIPQYKSCLKCNKYLSKLESAKDICNDCEGKLWF